MSDCEKSESFVAQMSKRNLEENDKNRVNYGNHNWIENSFTNSSEDNNNNKRVKTDNRWTPYSQLNCLVINQTQNTSEAMNADNKDNGDEYDDFNDGLDEYITQAINYSQSIRGPTQDITCNHSQPIGTTSDQNMSSQTTSETLVKSNEDVIMNSNGSHRSSNSSEASEGRLKILESRNNKLSEEVLKYKTQSIQTQSKIKYLEKENESKISQMTKNYESSITFERNEKTLQTQLIYQLQALLKQFAPNAPIVKTTAEYLRQRKKASQESFSQSKLLEFYAPLNSLSLSLSGGMPLIQTQSQFTPTNSGEILVPESQSSVGGKRPKLSDGFPSQIGSSQILSIDCSMNSLSQPMDINSGSPNEQAVRVSDSQISQTQSSRMAWNMTRVVLEHKFCADQQHLNKYLFEPTKLQEFDDQWIRDNQQMDDWTITLNQLNDELGLNI